MRPTPEELHEFVHKVDRVDPYIPHYTQEISSHERRIELDITHEIMKLTDDFTQTVWVYNGSIPAPTLRGRVGDTFHVVVHNSSDIAHNIDFHAGIDGSPDDLMKPIMPSETHEYTFTAKRTGIWLYHCSCVPMGEHMANGMLGAVIIEPENGLVDVNHEIILMQHEIYCGDNGQSADVHRLNDLRPDFVAFNGRAFQYVAHPIEAKVGDRVRIWIVNAGPNVDLAFHIVGVQFSTVWAEGEYTVLDNVGMAARRYNITAERTLDVSMSAQTGSQTVNVAPTAGAFVEFAFEHSGTYAFMNHIAAYAAKGAHGVFHVSE
ncbi:multicopper oxidase domain-containing protein [Alloscardovia venturai]|uniref:Copper-containing nitrite reductase n=1 Tax=Alloscardovia venturai TaxID=1769421 RepID=A0ABW2Y4B4_9BIFI